jgi:HK97 gp10 family phage protein
VKFTMKVEGESLVLGQLNTLDLSAQTEARKTIRKSAQRLRRGMRKRAPRDTGELHRNIRVKYFDAGLRALVGPMYRNGRYYPLAHLIELGTQPHTIEPETKKALKLSDGFATSVEHRGIAAQPFINPAWEEERPRYVREMKGALNKAVRKADRG